MVEIISFKVFDDHIEVVKRERSNIIYACNPPRPAPDKVWKEIYIVDVNGKISLYKRITGTHIPAHTSSERFEFNDGL